MQIFAIKKTVTENQITTFTGQRGLLRSTTNIEKVKGERRSEQTEARLLNVTEIRSVEAIIHHTHSTKRTHQHKTNIREPIRAVHTLFIFFRYYLKRSTSRRKYSNGALAARQWSTGISHIQNVLILLKSCEFTKTTTATVSRLTHGAATSVSFHFHCLFFLKLFYCIKLWVADDFDETCLSIRFSMLLSFVLLTFSPELLSGRIRKAINFHPITFDFGCSPQNVRIELEML